MTPNFINHPSLKPSADSTFRQCVIGLEAVRDNQIERKRGNLTKKTIISNATRPINLSAFEMYSGIDQNCQEITLVCVI